MFGKNKGFLAKSEGLPLNHKLKNSEEN